MIRILMCLVLCFFGSASFAQDTSYLYQQVQPVVTYPGPTVTLVPSIVQERVVVYTWEFRPIVIQNVVVNPYVQQQVLFYPRPCWFKPVMPYYINGPYRY